MEKDLTELLEAWTHDPGAVAARRIRGADGRSRLQLRVDLGILQMEEAGRPDGKRPYGYPTLLNYHLTMESTSRSGSLQPLTAEECASIQLEAAQFYHRYLAFSALGELTGVVEDCAHNLALIDLVLRRSEGQPAASALTQLYPFVRMMHARAQAEIMLDGDRPDHAAQAVQNAMKDIRTLARKQGLDADTGQLREIEALASLLVNLRTRRSEEPRIRLERQLDEAVEAEDFERAAQLRDELKNARSR